MKKEKILSISVMALSVAVICLAALQLLGIWEDAIRVFEPLGGVILLLQAIRYWNEGRRIAIFQLCAALFVLGVAVYILFF